MKDNKFKSKSKQSLDKLVKSGLEQRYEDRFDDRTKFGFSRIHYNTDKIRYGLRSEEVRNKYKPYYHTFTQHTPNTDYPNLKKRVLMDSKSEQLLSKITECRNKVGRGLVCGSFWCDDCRNFYGEGYEGKVNKILGMGFGFGEENRKYVNDDFFHITSVVGLCEFNSESVKKLISKDGLRWRKIRYRMNKLPLKSEGWIEGVYEFELVNWRYLYESVGSDFKKLQIKQLKDEFRIKDEVFVFVHIHSLGSFSNKDDLDYVLGEEYFINNKRLIKTDKTNGNFVQKLHTKKSLEENIRKITSYPFKSVYRFKHNYLGSNFKNGEYLTDNELGRLIMLYEEVKGRGGRKLYRSVENKRLFDWKRRRFNKVPIKDLKEFGMNKSHLIMDVTERKTELIDGKIVSVLDKDGKGKNRNKSVRDKLITEDDIRDDYLDVNSEVFWEDMEGNVKEIKDKLKRKIITKKILGKKLK